MSIFNKKTEAKSEDRISKESLSPQELKEAGARFRNVIRVYQEHIGIIDEEVLDVLRQRALKRVVMDRDSFKI